MKNRVKLKYIANIYKGKKPNNEYSTQKVGFLPYLAMDLLRGRNVIPSYVDINNEKVVTVKSDDILIIWDGSNSGEIVPAKEGVLSSTMGKISLKSDNFNTNYIKYSLINYEADLRGSTVGMGIPHVNGEILRNLNILNISLQEQQKIADYLDVKTALIDEIIKKKQNLIQALDDKKKALINDLVTGKTVWNGSTFSKPKITKDSGIQWLGNIPEHWEVFNLKYLTKKVGSGVTPKGGGEIYSDSGIKFIRSQNVYFEGLVMDDIVHITPEIHNNMKNSAVKYGDVLLNITGGSIGRSTIVETNEELNVNQHVCIIRPNDKLFYKYLNYFLFSDYGQINIKEGITGGNREGLNFENIKKFKISIPLSINDQINTVNVLDSNVIKINNIKSKISTQIEKLKEYRQAVIAEAVTGKIDVRNWTKPNN